MLPDGGYQFQLGREVLDTSLVAELDNIKKFISGSQSKEVAATDKQKVWNNVKTSGMYKGLQLDVLIWNLTPSTWTPVSLPINTATVLQFSLHKNVLMLFFI